MLLTREGLDGYLITDPANILYFTGFSGGSGMLISARENVLYVHGVDYVAARGSVKGCRIARMGWGERLDLKVAEAIKDLGIKHLGFDVLTASTFLKLKKALNRVELSPKQELVWRLRRVKDAAELERMRRAAELTAAGIRRACEIVQPGMRERELAAEIEYTMRRLGSDGVAFDTIVASGPHSAHPHAGCTDRRIQRGDLVVIDVGARYQHYCADLTRTLVVGKPTERQARILRLVAEAQERAIQLVRAGVEARKVDEAARTVIEEGGYGQYFVHGVGHGVGLEVHEPPSLNPKSEQILEENCVVTVEPGIYLPGFGGVRIEDTILVLRDGAETLTKLPRVFG